MLYELDGKEVSEDEFYEARVRKFAGHTSWSATLSPEEIAREVYGPERRLRFMFKASLVLLVLSGLLALVVR